jgi:hypothetical protein
MYYLSSSLADLVNYDKAVRAWAYECLRAAEVPVWEIDPDESARHNIDLEGLPETDDPEQAEAHYIDAFRRVHAEMLSDVIDDEIDALMLGDVAKYIKPIHLLQMPDSDSLNVAAMWFRDDDWDPDGDLWLAPIYVFSADELNAALAAGGKVIEGYEFYYPCAVRINPQLQCINTTGEVTIGRWCGYNDIRTGCALSREVATAVCAASIALAVKEEEERKSRIKAAARAVVRAWRSEPGGEEFLRALEALLE